MASIQDPTGTATTTATATPAGHPLSAHPPPPTAERAAPPLTGQSPPPPSQLHTHPIITDEDVLRATAQAQTIIEVAPEAEPEPLPSSSPLRPSSDFSDTDSAIGSQDGDSYTTSLASSVRDYNFENGRRYHKFREGRYVFPNDDLEQDREDMKHAMVMELCGGRLHEAPLGEYPQRVLDVGTGTGIWCIDMGDTYASAEVIGTDLSPIQPKWVPPNVRFVVDDCESDWVYPLDHFDYIHGRHISMAIRNWPKLFKQALKHLRPGGYVEFQEILVFPESDDGTLPDSATLRQYFRYQDAAGQKIGVDLHVPTKLAQMARDAGFVDLEQKIYKIPLGTWPKNEVLKKVGLFQRTQFLEGLPAISLGPYTRVLGWSMEELEVWLTEVRKAIMDRRTHSYHLMYFVYGRKPEVA